MKQCFAICTRLTQMMFNHPVSTKIPQKWLREKWESSAFKWIIQRSPMCILTKVKTHLGICYFSSEITMPHGNISGLFWCAVLTWGEIQCCKFAMVDKNISTMKKMEYFKCRIGEKRGKIKSETQYMD